MSRHHGHDHGHIEPPELVNIDDGVFAYVQPDGSWWINNCGILADGGDTVIVDTCSTERRTNLFLETVERLDSGPIRAVVNTHHHGDHTHGNWLTKPAAIIGHRRCREAILEAGLPHFEGVFEPVDWGDIQIEPPMVTFDDRPIFVSNIRLNCLGSVRSSLFISSGT
jgi:cyclase